MRISLKIDSATERELRDVLNAYVRATGRSTEVKVGLNGPACYSAETPPLKGREAWAFIDAMSEGTLLDDLVVEDHGPEHRHGDDGVMVDTLDAIDPEAWRRANLAFNRRGGGFA